MRLILLRCFLVLCLSLASRGAVAQNFSIEHWATQNGLKTVGVRSISESQDESLWIGTESGMVRFDGSHFKTLKLHNVRTDAHIDYVVRGPDSLIYVGTDSNFYVFGRGTSQNFLLRQANRALRVSVILPCGDDEAWIGADSGYLAHYKHGEIARIGEGTLPDAPIYGLAATPDKTLWLATGLGLFFLSNGKVNRYQPTKAFPVKAFYDLAAGRDGTLFAATDAGLFGIRGSQWTQWTKANRLPSDKLNVLAMDRHDDLWIGTDVGLVYLKDTAIHSLPVRCPVGALFPDTQGSLWVGCDSHGGIFRVTSSPAHLLKPDPSLNFAQTSLVEERDGAVWLGTPQGLYKYKDGHFRRFTRRNGLPSDWILNLSVTLAGTVLVSTAEGIASITDDHITTIRVEEGDPNETIGSAVETPDGSVWVTSGRGLGRRLPGQQSFSFLPGFTNLIESSFRDRSGALWIGTDSEGLYRLDGATKRGYRKADGLGSDAAYSIAEDNSGALWVWTYGGLSRIRDGKCENISPDAGLPKGKSGSLVYDGAGHLWLRTEDGIAAIDIDEANSVLADPHPLRKTRFFGSGEGLSGALSEPESLSLMVSHAKGQVWIPMAAGIAVLDISSKPAQAPDVRPQVVSVTSDSGDHDSTAPVRLRPGDVHLQFTYRCPALQDEPGRMYRYRLAGFDKDWRAGEEDQKASYTSLPAGTYRFEVSSRKPFQPWSMASDPIELVVLPHFYQTWWWYGSLLVTATAIIWFVYWLRLLTLRRQHAAVLAERDRERLRLARELHDTLSGGMMTIHMQLQLARASLAAAPDDAFVHLDSAVDLVRRSASETRRSIAALRSSEDQAETLHEALERVAEAFRLTCSIRLESRMDSALPSLPVDTQHELVRVVEEALSNVRRHSGAQNASLETRVQGKWLRLQIEDDGCGFETPSEDSGHFGVQGMRERARRIQGTLVMESVLGQGTKVLLELSLNRARRHGTDK